MRSKAHLKTHPIHPMLIGFPIAFYIGTLVFDVLAAIYSNEMFVATARYLHIASIISAVLAAIPGIIDYRYTVPPDSSAKKRATAHGLANSVALVLFSVALYLKYQENISEYLVIAIEVVAVALTFYAGWLGGTLVHRNQIGVDIRYAHAGKWKEMYITEEKGKVAVCKPDELKVNQMKLVHAGTRRIVVARTEEGYVAFDDRCPHKGGSLAAGAMICGTVQCPWHGSQFDVKTGHVTAGPAKESIQLYSTMEEEEKVFLIL